jgi:chromosomal replication initiation ATPase DnaA
MTTKAYNQSNNDIAKYKEVKYLMPNNVRDICKGVATANDIEFDTVFVSGSRKAECAILRHYASWLSCCMNLHTLSRIGRTLGKDHSTVIHSRNTVRNLFDANDGRINEVHRNYVNYLKGPECIYDFKEFAQQSF